MPGEPERDVAAQDGQLLAVEWHRHPGGPAAVRLSDQAIALPDKQRAAQRVVIGQSWTELRGERLDRIGMHAPHEQDGQHVVLEAGLRGVAFLAGRHLRQVVATGKEKKLARDHVVRRIRALLQPAIHAGLVSKSLAAHVVSPGQCGRACSFGGVRGRHARRRR
ncbi:hypothetical protein KEH57_36490 (plasmid) [Burkholderia cenocepacia]|uniref:hypothetical protein n=1 Tax=Burkholderia cenocepacia TaxID=95486 RepID=UPI001BA7F281|nr:hypothetical protein [Burkholderia cenocepacia]QUO30742.1 hypothetical protein KEH57_36490 [Burkholderia cenocepacia]